MTTPTTSRVVWLGVLCYVLVMSFWTVNRLLQGNSCTFDLGIHDQAVWLLAQGLNPLLTSRGLQVQADHFSPIAYGVAPLYLLWDSPMALLVLQTVWIACGAFPVYGLARRFVKSQRLAEALALLFLCQPCQLFMNGFDFHFAALMSTPLLWACYALESNARSRYYCAILTALSVSETAGFPLLGLAVVAACKRSGRAAVVTLLLALTALTVSSRSIQWHQSGQPTQYTSLYSTYGNSLGEVAWNVITHPLRSFDQLNVPDNREYGLKLLGPLLFTPVLGPVELLPALPVIAGNLLSWRSSQHSIRYHYNAGILPFLMWACCVGVARLERRWGSAPCLRGVVVASLVCFPLSPLWPNEWLPTSPPHQQALKELGELIPPDASLSVENSLGGALSHRQTAYLFPNPMQRAAWGSERQALVDQTGLGLNPLSPGEWRRALDRQPVEWIVAEPNAWSDFPMTRPDREYFLGELCACPAYGLSYARNGVVAFQRGKGRRATPSMLPRADFHAWRAHVVPAEDY